MSAGDRSVRAWAECAHPGAARRFRSETGPVRRQLLRHGVQRAEADRARIRLRAGDQEAHTSTALPVTRTIMTKPLALSFVVALAVASPAVAQPLFDVQSAVATFQNVRPIANQIYLKANGWEGKLDLYARRSQ